MRTALREPPPRCVSALVTCAVLLSLSGQAAGQNAPGQGPGEVPPGAPEPTPPEFALPQPNRGADPHGETASVSTPDPEKPAYMVSAFVIRYAMEYPSLPAVNDLYQGRVTVGRTDKGFVAVGGGVPEESFLIEDVALSPPQRWSSRALFAVSKAIVQRLNDLGVVGVTVAPVESEFAPAGKDDPAWGKDLRRPGQSAVTLVVRVGLVKEMRTVAFGERIPYDQRINAPQHRAILENAPVQVYKQDDPERRDVLLKDELEDYVFRLNRHPGRRVDLAVSAAQGEDGGIALDLLVNENKPWLAFFQISNTGTDETAEWRQRFGFVHNQLTGNDDILTLDFVTASFDASYAVNASYERPLWGESVRGRVYGSYAEYTASDVGFPGQDFNGDQYAFGGELIGTVFQHRELFVDLVGGVRFEHVNTINEAVNTSGETDFFLPYVEARLTRTTDTAATFVSGGFEWNMPDVAGTNQEQLDNMGRINPDRDWLTFQWDMSQSFYLDPLIYGDRWHDTGPNGRATLAHEVALSFRGQYAFDDRLIPNFEQTVGGMYTVRGYPESIVAGDTVLVGSAEYRFHVPQALGFDPTPGTLFGNSFRFKPQQPYGRADWDLVLKAFVDVGQNINSQQESFETDNTLVGTGLGVEFYFKRYLSIRMDWGVALEGIEGEVSSGESRINFSATILF